MAKFTISKSLNGDKIVWIAREGKHTTPVARADSEEALRKLIADRKASQVVKKEVKSEDDKPKKRGLRRKSSKKSSR